MSYEILPDGSVRVRLGSWGNCRGVTDIRARISRQDADELTLSYGDSEADVTWNDAVFRGVKKAWEHLHPSYGVRFELAAVLVHDDSSELMFEAAGFEALREWIDHSA